jgi:hypothetical protein
MKRLLLALGILCSGWGLAHAADSAVVVSSCGTPPTTYTAGIPFALTQNTSGLLCNTATISGSVTATNPSVGTTGSAPPASATFVGANGSGATGGLLLGLKTCDQHALYDASDNGSITLVAGVSGRKVYICGYILAAGGTATNLKLVEGSSANCAANAANLTPAYQLLANQSIGFQSPFWTGLVNSTAAYYVCVNASAGNSHQAEIWYSIQ